MLSIWLKTGVGVGQRCLKALVGAGINDWGGVSPLTPDHVNPESPWPHLDTLAEETAAAGKLLQERLTIYPAYARTAGHWLDARRPRLPPRPIAQKGTGTAPSRVQLG